MTDIGVDKNKVPAGESSWCECPDDQEDHHKCTEDCKDCNYYGGKYIYRADPGAKDRFLTEADIVRFRDRSE